MYNGQLITFKLKDKEALLCKSLFDIEFELKDEQVIMKDKKTHDILGNVISFYGIEDDDFFNFLNLIKNN